MMARIIYPNEGYAVQASSYGLLIYIQQNNYKDSVAIVKFLHSVRNTIGGFGGTQVDNNYTVYQYHTMSVYLMVATDYFYTNLIFVRTTL
jgi:hypothetical protein